MTGPDLDPQLSASMRRTILAHARKSAGRRHSPRQIATLLGSIALVAGVTAAAVVVIVAGLPRFGTTPPVANTPTTSATANPTPSSDPTSTPTPAISDTPTLPTGTPSSTPPEIGSSAGYDPADMGTWLITFDGIGPISLGTPLREVVDRIPGEPLSCRPGVDGFFGYSVVAAGEHDDPDSPVAMAITAFSSLVPADASRPSTAEGITYGSSVDDVLAAYPHAEEYITSMGAPAYRVTDGSSYNHFLTFGKPTVEAITVIRAPTTPKEYCG